MKTTTAKYGPHICHRDRSPDHPVSVNKGVLTKRARRLPAGGSAGIGLAVTVWLLLAGVTMPVRAGDDTNSPASVANSAAKPYPIDYCLICGDKVGGTNAAVVINYQGQELKFCCKRCVKTFKQDPAKYLKKLHDAENAGTDSKGAPGGEIPGH